VSEVGGNRLQIFDSVGNSVRVIAGSNGPYHLFVDSDDNILVTDFNNHRIQVINDGGHLKTIGQGQLSNPTGICMDNEGRIIVIEQTGHRISIF